jgi:hypothetical protein
LVQLFACATKLGQLESVDAVRISIESVNVSQALAASVAVTVPARAALSQIVMPIEGNIGGSTIMVTPYVEAKLA